jgi:hypothetical protein
VQQARFRNPYRYLLIFTLATALGVIIGREITIFLHNQFFYPEYPLRHFSDITFPWISYAVAIYVPPVALVFFARQAANITSPEPSARYYGFYILMTIIGFLVSTSVSAIILGFTVTQRDEFNFLYEFLDSMRWGILPALMSGFVAYQMDVPVQPSESLARMLVDKSLRFLVWGCIGMVITLYATDNLTVQEPHLRFSIVGTTVFVVGFLGMEARFKTVQTTR